ncbi:MAG: 3'-5' exonuclease [Cyanobacterium sp. T60_A2020_053]|nr:3'-5' exonuclease [Cyanobacterium sp. T60_A2020_053]
MYLTNQKDIEKVILELKNDTILWVDTEVADYKTKKPRLSLIQVLADSSNLDGDKTYMLDVLDQQNIIDFFIDNIMLDEKITKVFHNAQYDLRLLGKEKAKNIFCTFQFAKKIPYCFLPVNSYSLKSLTEYFTEFKNIGKEEQGSDWGARPLQRQQLEYAKMDCVYLAQIYHNLMNLNHSINVKFSEQSLEELTQRYISLEDQFKMVESERKCLKELITGRMLENNLQENQYLKLKINERESIKAQIIDLVNLINQEKLELNFEVSLTNDIQKQLGESLASLDVKTNKTISYALDLKH